MRATDRTSGRVIRADSGSCLVDTPEGTWRCTVRGRMARGKKASLRFVAVGDMVEVSPGGTEQGVIEKVLPRRTKLSRRASGQRKLEQVVAANVDQLIVVTSVAEPTPHFELVDRYLVAARSGELDAVICLNKIDLDYAGACAAESEVYRQLGYPVVPTSALSGDGLDRLREHFGDRISVIVGQSGVGKSTLLNAIEPTARLRTSPVSEKSGEGRHTTTATRLLKIGDGYVIDTPGIREYTLWEIEASELARFFPDFRDVADHCRFTNCEHTHEPNCAAKRAVEEGTIDKRRYQSYVRMLSDVRLEAASHPERPPDRS